MHLTAKRYKHEDVDSIVADAIDGLENISEEDVETIVNNIVDDLNNLGYR